jgi:hypothetical protein
MQIHFNNPLNVLDILDLVSQPLINWKIAFTNLGFQLLRKKSLFSNRRLAGQLWTAAHRLSHVPFGRGLRLSHWPPVLHTLFK